MQIPKNFLMKLLPKDGLGRKMNQSPKNPRIQIIHLKLCPKVHNIKQRCGHLYINYNFIRLNMYIDTEIKLK